MTLEEMKHAESLYRAMQNPETRFQVHSMGSWTDGDPRAMQVAGFLPSQIWRINAEPKRVPFTWETIPYHWFRDVCAKARHLRILSLDHTHVRFDDRAVLYANLDGYEHSEDRQTWLPCTTEVEA